MLKINNLTIGFLLQTGFTKVVNDVSFHVNQGEILGIMGESGSGKSMTALAIMNLVHFHGAKILDGTIMFQEKNILEMSERDLQRIRGNDIAMIFQDPFSSLNPSFTIFQQLAETLHTHTSLNKNDIQHRCIELMQKVHMPHPHAILKKYPHQLSGGMRQRVMIAMALACNPKLLIADEPTTALDVTIQKEILELLLELQASEELTIIFISHDIGVIEHIADNVVIMYKSEVVEQGNVKEVLKNPKHKHTKELIQCRKTLMTPNL